MQAPTTEPAATPRDTTPTVARKSYSPAQQRIIELLGRGAGDGPTVEAELVSGLRAELEERLAPVAEQLPDGQTLWVGKSPLASYSSCPGRWQAERELPFSWSVPSARGTVAHKAIELAVNWRGEVEPGRAVDEAVSRLADDDGTLAQFLRTLSTVELAELRSEAVGFATAFEECFPPLRSRWRPVIDGRLRVDLCGGRIVLSGRPDLTLGRAVDAGKVIIDFKTGSRSHHHVDDLRFYALLDTLKVGVAPRRLATLYLDSGQPMVETVTTGVLEAATERVVRSVAGMVAIRTGQATAALQPGRMCRWCPAAGRCEAGTAFLAAEATAHTAWEDDAA